MSTVTTTASSWRLPPFPVRPFTVNEYHQLIQIGLLNEGDPFELLEGWITPKMTQSPAS
jgi:hypothetical protein